MKRMIIGMDIDGTITGAYDWLPYANQYFAQKKRPEAIHCYDIHMALGVDRMAYRSFYESFKYLLHANNTPRPRLRHTMEHWLEKHSPPNIPLHMLGGHDKVPTARTLSMHPLYRGSLRDGRGHDRSGHPRPAFRYLL